ncbi:MAG: hypothetical protein KAU36_09055, partial [candidate division Zixibacteria bacterium]|nr:hypothetical protein [candidate division Zixibacteria bacterium]
LPDTLLTPEIDGRMTHFYEWAGAGTLDCLKAGQAMHRVQRHISNIYFAFDHECLYVRLDFVDKKEVELIRTPKVRLTLTTPEPRVFDLSLNVMTGDCVGQDNDDCRYRFKDLVEIAIGRTTLIERGYGEVGLAVSLLDGDQVLESWPEKDSIKFELPEKNREMFWPS